MTLTGALRGIVLGLCVTVLIGSVRGQAPAPERDPQMTCSLQTRTLAMGVMHYAQKHGGKLPPTMYAALEAYALALGKAGPEGVAEVARASLISPAHAEVLRAPRDITQEWANEQSSYKYLGNGDVTLDDVQDWGGIVVMHQRLEMGHQGEPTPQNPTGELFSLAFLDGHVELCGRAHAERLIAESAATLDSFRTGAPAPDDRQAIQNLALILKAVHAYAKAHDGRLPPDVGATLAYLPTGLKATDSAEKRARIYLSPRTRTTRSVPDEPTPEWVNANSWYTYLGTSEVLLEEVPETNDIALFHARMDDGFQLAGALDQRGGEVMRVPVGMVSGRASLQVIPEATWRVRESVRTISAIQTGEAIPEWVHQSRDVRVLSEAMQSYAKAHAGVLPPDLGALVEHLPARIPGDRRPDARARVFLSPRAEAVAGAAPEAFDAAWVRANANYVYVGPAGAKLSELDWPATALTLHSPLDEGFRLEEEPREVVRVSIGHGAGWAWSGDRAWVEKTHREIRSGTPAQKKE